MKSKLLMALSLFLAGTTSAAPIVFTLGSDPVRDYLGEDVGPYEGTLTNTHITGFFCLDESLQSTFGKRYTGTEAAPITQQEQEAAFLAALGLHFGPALNGPISYAIWEVMGGTSLDPSAAQYIQLAEYAYAQKLIRGAMVDQAFIFTPSDVTVQRFITAVPDDSDITAALESMSLSSSSIASTPEGSTVWLTALCLAFLCSRCLSSLFRDLFGKFHHHQHRGWSNAQPSNS